jgi:membrane protease YdiL (CAAX protease family)
VTPYHRLAATTSRPVGRAALEVVGLVVAFALFAVGVLLVAEALGLLGVEGRGPLLGEYASGLVLVAVVIPAVLVVVRVVGRRPPGTVSSVAGRLRWGWLAVCSAVLAVVAVPVLGAALVADPPRGGWDGVDWDLVAQVAAISVVLVPFQAAAEEYLFRGHLAQLVGAYVRSPWVPAVALSLLFGLAHGTEQGWWSFVDRAGFGLVAAWLTLRTGGLEAAVALHAVGNVAITLGATVVGELEQLVFGPEEPATAETAVIDLVLLTALAAFLIRLARRRGIATAGARPEP